MFCQKCGSQIPEGALSCPACGSAVVQSQPQAESQYQQAPPQYQQAPPQYQQAPPQPQQPVQQKSKLAAGLLAIFVGTLGIHNFYLGYTTKGLIQLLVSLLTFGVGAVAIAIWALIEGIFYLTGHEGYTTDANGIPLSD